MKFNPEHAPKGFRAICGTGSTLVDCPKCCFGPREKCKGPSRYRPCVQHLRSDGANVYFTKTPEEALVSKITFTPAPQAAKIPRSLYIHIWVNDQNGASTWTGTTKLDEKVIAEKTRNCGTYIGVLKVSR